jgi:hypothetical protein
MASGRTKSRTLSTENIKRISTDEITSLALSRQLQEAVRISDEVICRKRFNIFNLSW